MSHRDKLVGQLNQMVEETTKDELSREEIKKLHNFYKVQLDKDAKFKSLTIDRVKLLLLLKDNGFYRYDLTVDKYCFIRIRNKKVKLISITYITDWFFEYLKQLPNNVITKNKKDENGDEYQVEIKITAEQLQNKFLMSMGSYFSEAILSRLTPRGKIQFSIDKKEQKLVYYLNGYVIIDKNGCHFHSDYSDLKDHVWENQILNRNYNPHQEINYRQAEFYQFCFNVSGQDMERFKSLQTIIGYVLHGYNQYKMKATILTDAQIGIEGEANGRTGKGIFATGLGKMMNNDSNEEAQVYCQINGKNFDFEEKHKYSNADINTKLIHLEDVKAYFPFDNLFNDITDNVSVNVKFEKPFTIKPKLLISTNKTIKISGASAEDRAIQFEFAEHYSQNHSPEDEFGKWLFTDWDKKEWELFDAFMCQSMVEFFKNDVQVIEPPKINLHRRALIEHTAMEFINFMDYYQFTDEDYTKESPKGFYIVADGQEKKEYAKKDLYNEFIESYPDLLKRKRFGQAKFTTWLRAYADASDFLQPINPELDERRSSGKDYIVFKKIIKENL